MKLTSTEIVTLLSEAGIGMDGNYVIGDSAYMCPTKQWVLGKFSSALSVLRFAFRVNKWISEENDCDDFARLTAAFAQILHSGTRGHERDTALLVGEAWYLQDAGTSHAINIIFCGPNAEDIMFFEPQTGKEVFLSERERQHTSHIRF